jgi:hypothetical protein
MRVGPGGEVRGIVGGGCREEAEGNKRGQKEWVSAGKGGCNKCERDFDPMGQPGMGCNSWDRCCRLAKARAALPVGLAGSQARMAGAPWLQGPAPCSRTCCGGARWGPSCLLLWPYDT